MNLSRLINLKLDFIHPGIRYRILKFLCEIFGLLDRKFIIDFYRFKYQGVLRNHIDFITYFFGSYERGILQYLKEKILRKEMLVLDVGANIGHHSLFFAANCIKVISFEPYPKVRKLIEEKIEMNSIKNIEIVPFGLSDQEQELEYFEPPNDNSGVGSFHKGHSSLNKTSGTKFRLITGDQYFREHLDMKVDFIKIDVEGFEHFVLLGLKKTLLENRPLILLEFNPQTQEYCKTLEGFLNLFPPDYRVLRFKKVFHKIAKLTDFNFEQAGDINLLCIPSEKIKHFL